MEIILLERVEKLGRIGDVVTVKDGFARNFLLPRKKALRANDANRRVFEANRERLEADNAARRTEAEGEAKSLDGVTVTLIRQASNVGQLYGSVAVRDLVEALEKPIKSIGLHEVRVALHPEVSVTVKVNVARSPEEAEMQAQGVDVMAAMFEKEESGFVEERDPNLEAGEIVREEETTEEPEA
jgi:large subunit ribosomal protein L9